MSIRGKILIPMISVAVVCCVSLGLLCVLSLIAFVSEFNDTQLEEAHTLAVTLFDQHYDEAARASKLVAENEHLIDAMADMIAGGDQKALANTAVSLMNAVAVDFITVTDKAGKVLARAHEPDNYGDSIMNQTNVQRAITGKQYTTIEQGTAVKLSVRSGTPVYGHDGELIGVVSLGYRLDQDGFVDYIKKITDTEVTVFLGDTRISTTVLSEAGQRAVGTQASADVSGQVLAGSDYKGRANVVGRNLYTYYSPLRNVEGDVLGMLFVGLDTSALDSHMARNITLLVFEVCLFMVLTTLAALFISHRIGNPLIRMADAARRLAAGDLDIKLNPPKQRTRDETKQLEQAFAAVVDANHERADVISAVAGGDLSGNITPRSDKDEVSIALIEMLDKNNAAFARMNIAASQLDNVAAQVAGGAQTLSRSAEEQTATVEEINQILKALSDRTAQKATEAVQAASLTENVKKSAEKGSMQMNNMIDAVEQISHASEAIRRVMKTVDDIAFQTNILALNAAVEAARAGQHGKGFAVVADEVRSLAAKSAEAAKDTETLISNSIEKAKLGAQISAETASSFADIVQGINESGEIVREIAEFMQSQNMEITSITQGVDEISTTVQNISASAQESAASSEEMSSQATLMAAALAGYKLREGQTEEHLRLTSGRRGAL